jgi:predicted DNA-binding antitoxin AbrB/MazE fold protein
MRQRILVICENGVLRSLEPLDLPEGSIFTIEIIEVLGNSAEFIKGIEKDLPELENNERNRPEKKIDDGLR